MSTRANRGPRDGGGHLAIAPGGTRRRRMRGETGYILAMTGLLLIPLLIFTAFAVDLGSWYAQGARMQRSIDAAALAGVVQLPNQTNAKAAADAVLKDNGFDPATYSPTYSYPSGAGEQMSITLRAPGKQYFSQLVLPSQNLSRSATAVYNLRIPLGSPSNVFGNDPSRAGAQPNLWAAIQGPYTTHANGDPYATKCAGAPTNSTTCAAANTLYNANDSAYNWAIDVPATALNQPITVSIYDPAHGNKQCTGPDVSPCPVGTTIAESQENAGFSTSYQLFNTTGASSNLDLTSPNGMNTLGRCSGGTLGYKVFPPGQSAANFTAAWYDLCTFTPTVAGIYPLQVRTSNIPSVVPDIGGGWNVYSLKAVSSSATQPTVYAIDKMSMWTPEPAAPGFTTARFYLASIGQQYAGHTLVVDLFDPGDGTAGNSPFTMQFLAPPSGTPAIVPSAGTPAGCNYNISPATSPGGNGTPDASANCQITTLNANSNAGIYNDRWLRVSINIPSTYTCTNDCWWTVKYDFGNAGKPTDRTVWVVNVLGDPVHLTK